MDQDRLLRQFERNKARLEQAQTAVKKRRHWNATFTGVALSITSALGGAIGGLALEATTNFTKETVPPILSALSCYVQYNLLPIKKTPSQYTVVVLPFANDIDEKATSGIEGAFHKKGYTNIVRPCVRIAPPDQGDLEAGHAQYVDRISAAFEKYGADLIVFGAVQDGMIKINGANLLDLDVAQRRRWGGRSFSLKKESSSPQEGMSPRDTTLLNRGSSLSDPGSYLQSIRKNDNMDGVAGVFLDRVRESILDGADRMRCDDTMFMQCSYINDKDSLKSLYDLINKALDVYSLLVRAGVDPREEKYGPFALRTYALVRDAIIARANFDEPFPEEQQYQYIPRQMEDLGTGGHIPSYDQTYSELKNNARLYHIEEDNLMIGEMLMDMDGMCTYDGTKGSLDLLQEILGKFASHLVNGPPESEQHRSEIVFAYARGSILFARIAEVAFALAESESDRQEMKDWVAKVVDLLSDAEKKFARIGIEVTPDDVLAPGERKAAYSWQLTTGVEFRDLTVRQRLSFDLQAVRKVAATLTPSFSAEEFRKSFELIRPKGCPADTYRVLAR
jgi:hypothetical protein